jgi:PAS domain S-box-containing protein
VATPSNNFPDPAEQRRRAAPELCELQKQRPMMTELSRRAEARLRAQQKGRAPKAGIPKAETDIQRLLHEAEVHQIELEMQNTELQESRDKLEALLEKFTDFYNFAPVGYFSISESGVILEVNLTGAALLGVGRSRLINRRLPPFVAFANRPNFLAFLERVFANSGKQVCEAMVVREDGTSFWADIQGSSANSVGGPGKWCRVVVSDITALKQAAEAQRRAEALAVSNEEFRREIARRQVLEKSLKQSEQEQTRLLEQSRYMQERLRHLSRQVLQAQEDERKRISRELHDVITQTLTGINIRLGTLKKVAGTSPKDFTRDIELTQKLVENSVNVVHQFARDLRPAVLDDLGLVPALHAFLKTFTAQTGIHVHLTAFAGLDELDISRRTTLYRVAQEALTNVSRHAKASQVEVTIQKNTAGICMKINDNGKSFSVKHLLHGKGGRRLGLLGMRERLEMVGGRFEIESAVGDGTTVTAEMPIGKRGKMSDTVR